MAEGKASSSRKGRALCPHKKDPRNGSVGRKEGRKEAKEEEEHALPGGEGRLFQKVLRKWKIPLVESRT